MKGKMFLESEFSKGTSITFFVPLIKVQPNLNNHQIMMPPSNRNDGFELENVSSEVNHSDFQLKKDVERYEYLIRQSASRMRFNNHYVNQALYNIIPSDP